MNRRRIVAMIAAVVLTLSGTLVLIAFVNAAEQRAQEGAELVTIFVATEEIAPGTPSNQLGDLITPRQVPRNVRADDAVTDLASVRGQVTIDRIFADAQIIARQFGERATAKRPGQPELEEGRQVVSLALEPQRALGGQLAQGETVGVIISLDAEGTGTDSAASTDGGGDGDDVTGMRLTGVQVVSVEGADQELSTGGEGAPTGALMISLDVDESDAEALVHGAEFGHVWLTRQPETVDPPDDRTQRRDNMFGGPDS